MITKGQLALRSVPLMHLSIPSQCANNRSLHHLHKPLSRTRIPTTCRTPLGPSNTLRFASTSQRVATDAKSLGTRLKNLFLGSALGLFLVFGYYYVTDTRAGIHQWVVVPSLRWIYDDAEEAHEAGTKALKSLYEFGLHPRERGNGDAVGDLQVEVFGHVLSNPIGTSAGIDKHAEIPSPLLAIGPAVIEVGGATPYPQDGNPKPRVFRLPSQKAVINRYGLNSEGADSVAMRLRQRVREYAYAMGFGLHEDAEQRVLDGEAGVPPGSLVEGKLMAVQVAKNNFTPDNDIEAVKRDYVYCVEALARYADIIVVNVSSPNTPGLRGLQRVEPLTNILTGVVQAAKKANRKTTPAVMVKVSPDEDSDEQVSGICDAVWDSGVDGVIVGNTTKRRPDALPAGYTLPEREARLLLEQGGYSGPQLFERTVSLVKRYRRMLDDRGRGKPAEASPPPKPPSRLPSSEKTPKPVAGPPSGDAPETTIPEKIEATIQRDTANLKETTKEAKEASKSQPLIRLPERNDPFASEPPEPDGVPALSSSTHLDQLPPASDDPATSPSPSSNPAVATSSPPSKTPVPTSPATSSSSSSQQKVIFATGGITNGKQALEVLNAGASVAMVYTALVYGGVGTISRIKGEMREEIGKIKGGGGK
ncbi:MAG: FMN-linked oxidoreductase [Lasallia pustulata]|uniref:Dihydroorotate dehydrogenase (quinone), mitochondrial n=1 Tax=Lasallia pustulata TaxID=136370 RepID=A0A5M8PXI0_9LECA|nr:MAG: FMN-linked oxidoreductase [Lasallia pustulata]